MAIRNIEEFVEMMSLVFTYTLFRENSDGSLVPWKSFQYYKDGSDYWTRSNQWGDLEGCYKIEDPLSGRAVLRTELGDMLLNPIISNGACGGFLATAVPCVPSSNWQPPKKAVIQDAAIGYVKNILPDGTLEVVMDGVKQVKNASIYIDGKKIGDVGDFHLKYSDSQADEKLPGEYEEEQIDKNSSECCGATVGYRCEKLTCSECQKPIQYHDTCRTCRGKGYSIKVDLSCETCYGTGRE
jgi:hypothetical protein